MRLKLVCLAALFVLFSSVIRSQEFRATITGRVTDASGAIIAGAKVDATNQATSQVASTVTDTAGIYTIPLLQPGTYTVSANANGFKNYVHANIVLNTGDRTGVDIQMEVGEVQQTVTVSAETPPIETQTATLGFVVNGGSHGDPAEWTESIHACDAFAERELHGLTAVSETF